MVEKAVHDYRTVDEALEELEKRAYSNLPQQDADSLVQSLRKMETRLEGKNVYPKHAIMQLIAADYFMSNGYKQVDVEYEDVPEKYKAFRPDLVAYKSMLSDDELKARGLHKQIVLEVETKYTKARYFRKTVHYSLILSDREKDTEFGIAAPVDKPPEKVIPKQLTIPPEERTAEDIEKLKKISKRTGGVRMEELLPEVYIQSLYIIDSDLSKLSVDKKDAKLFTYDV